MSFDAAVADVLAMGRTLIANGMSGYQAAMLTAGHPYPQCRICLAGRVGD